MLVNNMQASNDFKDRYHSSVTPAQEGATGKYQGFYESVLRKKREVQDSIFEDQKKEVDLDAELQKLEMIKQQRRSKYEEQRDRVNQAKMD